MTANNCATNKNYHHGDLRNALIVAAAELITESGSVDFAMVDAARRAGVSSAAPYRHFKDKDDLLSEVARLGFYGLTTATAAEAEKWETGSEEAIYALGKVYLEYVCSHPQFFDLISKNCGSIVCI